MEVQFAWVPVARDGAFGEAIGPCQEVTLPFLVENEHPERQGLHVPLTPVGLLGGILCMATDWDTPLLGGNSEGQDAVPGVLEWLRRGFDEKTQEDMVLNYCVWAGKKYGFQVACMAYKGALELFPHEHRLRADYIMKVYEEWQHSSQTISEDLWREVIRVHSETDKACIMQEAVPALDFVLEKANQALSRSVFEAGSNSNERLQANGVRRKVIDNTGSLEELFANQHIALSNSNVLKVPPNPLPESWDSDRIEGMLLGVAIGDSLGNTSESMSPAERRAHYGEISDYLPNRYASNLPLGLPSDDTQMTFWTVEQLLEDGGLNPEHLARRFCSQRIFGLGRTVREFIRRHKDQGLPWFESGVASAGNGALMRISPVLVPHMRNPSVSLWADAAIAAMLTHNDSGSTATCVAFVSLLWETLRLPRIPESGWWLNTFCRVAKELEGDTNHQPRHPSVVYRHCGPISEFTARVVSRALDDNLSVLDACESWHSGAYLLETVPCVIYILEKCAHDPRLALVRAVNDTRDNDTIASIVGAAVGALHGPKRFPEKWVQNLSGKTAATNDGHVFDLLEQCRRSFGF